MTARAMTNLALGVTIGPGVGMVLGLALHGPRGLALGLALGAGVGVVVGAALDEVVRRRRGG